MALQIICPENPEHALFRQQVAAGGEIAHTVDREGNHNEWLDLDDLGIEERRSLWCYECSEDVRATVEIV